MHVMGVCKVAMDDMSGQCRISDWLLVDFDKNLAVQ